MRYMLTPSWARFGCRGVERLSMLWVRVITPSPSSPSYKPLEPHAVSRRVHVCLDAVDVPNSASD